MISKNIIEYDFVKSFNEQELKKAFIIPIKNEGIYLKCFVCIESNISLLSTNMLLKTILISKDEIEFFLSDLNTRIKLYDLVLKSIKIEDAKHQYIKNFFDILVNKAISSRASDIHIETLHSCLSIRFRVDGQLKIFYIFKKEFFIILSSYIKMLSKIDITQTRLPLDGRFSFLLKEDKYDFRVSTIPTIEGESIVLRILHNKNINKKIQELGFSTHIYDEIKNIVKLTSGLVLITGPTGSGKSTTLYSIIKKLNIQSKKIITIEDPVEYKVDYIQQVSVNESIGLSFDTILRNILRQDPDIILISEIRDKTSLDIALQASLTGHLVLASIHANNSVETLFRLSDLKADKYLLSSTLKYIISQRLVLNICRKCNKKGCENCNFSGFYERSSIAEALKIDNKISSMIFNSDNLEEIKDYLKNIKFKTMLDDGKEKIKQNLTTIEEVYKVLGT